MLPINPLQFRTLGFLSTNNFVSAEDVSVYLPTTRQTARNQLRSLINKGYAERVPNHETTGIGAICTRITNKGRQALTFDFTAVKQDLQQERKAARAAAKPDPTKIFEYVSYVPPPMQSVRPGADDHLQFKSRGF